MGGEITRRNALSMLGGSAGALLAGCTAPATEQRPDVVDLDELENVLEIPSGTTHAIGSNDSETYDSIRWEASGALELADGAAIELTEINQS